MDDWSNELSNEIAALAGGQALEERQSSLQKRSAETWAEEEANRKRAKSAMDHAAHPNSFASLSDHLSSMQNCGNDIDNTTHQDAMDTAIAVPVPTRVPARKSSADVFSYREEPATMDLMGDTEDVQFASQLTNAALNLTETQPESASAVYKRIKLHPHVIENISPEFHANLVQLNMAEFEIGPLCPVVTLRRETFVKAAKGCREQHSFRITKMSKDHVAFELLQEPGGRYQVYAVDKNSVNGTKVDGEVIPRGGKMLLRHNQCVTILSSTAGTVLLGYIVEDPHVLMAQQIAPTGQPGTAPLPTIHSLENVLELDLAKEYNNLKDALIDASKRMVVTEVSREVTLSVHFATSDSLRSLMTLGCRAFHFSGHGSPQHLYFEDGLGTVHPIPIHDLKNLCVSHNSPLRLVVVQACYSHNVGASIC
ncbi:hypothetical protein DYB25_009686 [Aphanomyces astaci]|uniref:FHA domain-containing protein n=1 Tax=Aphanomyces astaci TaxID=112090 RepID=A0A397AG44_APHAT|nr:hypothetical protein DYB25_009686 [Aphanomyces astaci]RHY45189.1 hypothetical protein DYB34_006271 [Aphanomyces astaci]